MTTIDNSFTTWFCKSAGIILAVTGAAKILSALGSSKILTLPDPITGIQFGYLMLAAGVIELVIAIVCMLDAWRNLGLTLVGGLATDLLIYRFGLLWLGWQHTCPCLGNMTDAVHISPRMADDILKVVLAYLLLGSYGILIQRWWKNRTMAMVN